MESISSKGRTHRDHLNEVYVEVDSTDFRDVCHGLHVKQHALLRLMFATDEREKDGCSDLCCVLPPRFRRIYVHCSAGKRGRCVISFSHADDPAVHWYEREISDLLVFCPLGIRPAQAFFHEAFPAGAHPLRKD